MNHTMKIAFGPVDTGALRLHPLHRHADDLRTLLRQCLLDRVLPALTLLSISALTTVTIVLVVTAVANAGWHLAPKPVNVDPSAGWYFGRAAPSDQIAYPGGELAAGEFIDGERWPPTQIEAGVDTSVAVSSMR